MTLSNKDLAQIVRMVAQAEFSCRGETPFHNALCREADRLERVNDTFYLRKEIAAAIRKGAE